MFSICIPLSIVSCEFFPQWVKFEAHRDNGPAVGTLRQTNLFPDHCGYCWIAVIHLGHMDIEHFDLFGVGVISDRARSTTSHTDNRLFSQVLSAHKMCGLFTQGLRVGRAFKTTSHPVAMELAKTSLRKLRRTNAMYSVQNAIPMAFNQVFPLRLTRTIFLYHHKH